MFQSRTLTILCIAALVVLALGMVWLRSDASAPKGPLFSAASRRSSDVKSQALTELIQLGEAAEQLRFPGEDGTATDLALATRDHARARAAEFLRLEVVEQFPVKVAAGIAALRRDNSDRAVDTDSSWRPLLLVGKVLSLRAEALMASEGPEAAWGQARQCLDFADALYRSAGSLSQIAIARTIQGFSARIITAAIAARAWPPAVLVEVARCSESWRLGRQLLRTIDYEYMSAIAVADAESRATSALVRSVLYQPNRTESLWSSTLAEAVRALSEDKTFVAYRLATSTPPVREQVPILWRNWIGYKSSVPSIESCVDAISLIARAELQMQLVGLAASIGLHHAEFGELPQSLEVLVKRFSEVNILDPWRQPSAALQYDANAGVVYSVGANQTDEHFPDQQSFDIRPKSDDYGVRLVFPN